MRYSLGKNGVVHPLIITPLETKSKGCQTVPGTINKDGRARLVLVLRLGLRRHRADRGHRRLHGRGRRGDDLNAAPARLPVRRGGVGAAAGRDGSGPAQPRASPQFS